MLAPAEHDDGCGVIVAFVRDHRAAAEENRYGSTPDPGRGYFGIDPRNG